jgi:hypothetical protein
MKLLTKPEAEQLVKQASQRQPDALVMLLVVSSSKHSCEISTV